MSISFPSFRPPDPRRPNRRSRRRDGSTPPARSNALRPPVSGSTRDRSARMQAHSGGSAQRRNPANNQGRDPQGRDARYRSAPYPDTIQPRTHRSSSRPPARRSKINWRALRALRSPFIPASQALAPATPRLITVGCILLVGMLLLMLNLFRIQVLQAQTLQERARAQQVVYLNATVPRRAIVDRAGTVLAIDRPVFTLYAHPIMFQKDKQAIAAAISPIVKMPPGDVVKAFDQGDSGIRVVDGLTEDLARQVREFEFDGIELVQEQQRLYPQQDLFANVVGYVNVDRKGQSGVEYSLEKELQQPIDAMALSRSGDGSIIPVGLPKNFLQQQQDDSQLQLTLDTRLQRATRLALRQQVDKYNAKRGAVIVMDVQDGSLLSLVSEPSYDPNKYYDADLEQLRNWVLTDLYEPGSTFKPVNLAIAIQAGSIRPTDTFYDEGAIQIGEWTVQNSDFDDSGGRGQLSVTDILKYSSNVGMVHVMQTLEPGVYYGWLSRIGLDRKTGIDLPSEAEGQMKSYSQFTNAVIEPATTAFGQGFSLTPIKLIQLHSMIANGGKMVTPHVVRGLVNAEGKLVWKPDLIPPNQIFSPETTEAVLQMMEQVVVDGTGKVAQIPGYRIGGKTGTAQKASPTGGYTNARITSFVSLFPIDKPRYAVLAVVDEPQGDDAYGSTVAAPIVKAVMEAMIRLEHIPPSQMVNEEEVPEESIENRQELPGNYTVNEPAAIDPADPQAYGNESPSDSYPVDSAPAQALPVDNYSAPIEYGTTSDSYPSDPYPEPDAIDSAPPEENWAESGEASGSIDEGIAPDSAPTDPALEAYPEPAQQ